MRSEKHINAQSRWSTNASKVDGKQILSGRHSML